jgi:hypothetical protein
MGCEIEAMEGTCFVLSEMIKETYNKYRACITYEFLLVNYI